LEYGGAHSLFSAPLLGGATGRDDSHPTDGILAAGCGNILSSDRRKDYFRLCLSGLDPKLFSHAEILWAVQSLGPGSAADRCSLSSHDLVVGNQVLGWSRIILERKVLREAEEVLILMESFDQG
jgi:hypothetical protein